ncbi:MAG TPA: hypothetical protein VK004_05875 [Ignavibacteria bacterium]|nr:hypothetical protein [Ignavibacteria bacterium]
MNYDKPKLRSFRHNAPSISIWYSLVIHVIIFFFAIALAKVDLRYAADDLKQGAVSILTGLFQKELTPEDSDINQLFRYESNINFQKINLKTEKTDS